ncbi:MAG: hypothetical protein AAB506_01985 [Patescibacteria group bacterium]
MKNKLVEINFGTLFRVLEWEKPTKRIDVITDVCQDDWFEAGNLKFNKKGEAFLSPVGYGTGGPEVFSEIVGRMDPDAVIEAVERGWVEFGHTEVPKEIYKELDRIKGGKRKLKLK